MTKDKIKESSNIIPDELKLIFKDAPRDDVDWALVMYLFRNAKYPYGYSCLFEEKNVITIRKVANWFDLEYDDVYKRLRRMTLWISVWSVYGYYKSFDVCNITKIGIDTIMKVIELFKIEEDNKEMNWLC